MKYAYQRTGAPLLSWDRTPPQGTRASDAKALGSLGGSSLDGPTLELPRAGAPEPVGGLGGCGCHSGVGTLMAGDPTAPAPTGIVGRISGLSTTIKIAGAVGAFLLYKKLSKKKRK